MDDEDTRFECLKLAVGAAMAGHIFVKDVTELADDFVKFVAGVVEEQPSE